VKRPQGPDLKMPDLKVPQFAADVYYDLRDRRLLPLVALVVVAIVAVPFLLGGDPDEVQPPPADSRAQSSIATTEARLTVVQGKPGLRDYRKRLRGRSATDPFKQRYTGLPPDARLKSVEVTSTGAVESVSGSDVEAVTEIDQEATSPDTEATSPDTGGSGSKGNSSGGTGSRDDGLKGGRLYGFRPDVRFGVAGSGELKLYDELPLGSLLPKKKAVLLFVGVTQNGKRALFSLTPEVSMVRGDGDCIGGAQNCRILSIQAGQAVDLTTASPGRAFRLKVEQIEFVELPMPKTPDQASGSSTGSGEAWAQGLSQSFSK